MVEGEKFMPILFPLYTFILPRFNLVQGKYFKCCFATTAVTASKTVAERKQKCCRKLSLFKISRENPET